MYKSQQTGRDGEKQALIYLQDHGLKLIQANFHSRFGEIDLIMDDNGTTVFIEVKYRAYGIDSAVESVNYFKQQKLVKTAQYYLLKHGGDVACRFDVVAVASNQQIEWLKNVIIL